MLDQRPQCRATGVCIKQEHDTKLTITFISHIDTEKHFYSTLLLKNGFPHHFWRYSDAKFNLLIHSLSIFASLDSAWLHPILCKIHFPFCWCHLYFDTTDRFFLKPLKTAEKTAFPSTTLSISP